MFPYVNALLLKPDATAAAPTHQPGNFGSLRAGKSFALSAMCHAFVSVAKPPRRVAG